MTTHTEAAEAHDAAAIAHDERRSDAAKASIAARKVSFSLPSHNARPTYDANAAVEEAYDANDMREDGEGRAADAAHDRAAKHHRAAAAAHRRCA